jgi:hypothetical protein
VHCGNGFAGFSEPFIGSNVLLRKPLTRSVETQL